MLDKPINLKLTSGSIKVCNQPIWCNKRLKFYGMAPFMAIVHTALNLGGSDYGSDSAINKTPAILQRSTLIMYCFGKHFKILRL